MGNCMYWLFHTCKGVNDEQPAIQSKVSINCACFNSKVNDDTDTSGSSSSSSSHSCAYLTANEDNISPEDEKDRQTAQITKEAFNRRHSIG